MAYIWTEQKLVDNNKRAFLKFTLEGDNTATSNTLLVDVSNLKYALNTNGYIMSGGVDAKSLYKTTIKRIFGQMSDTAGYSKLQWHINGSNTTIVTIGSGNFDYDMTALSGDISVIPNTDSANSSGDILYSAVGHTNAHSLTLFIELKKDATDYDSGQTADPTAFNKTGIL